MLRKLISLLLCLLIFAIPVSADILWEPHQNAYYNKVGYDEFSYMNRTYVVPEGMTANLYENPETGGLIRTLEAGTRIYIGPYATIDDEVWAAGYPKNDFETQGWVRLNRLQLEYDHQAFAEEYGDQFVTTDDLLTRQDIDSDVLSWTYPGSGISDRAIPPDALGGGYNDGVMNFQFVYTDPDGGRWGYVGYYMGRCGWVWLDDPTNPEPSYHLQQHTDSTVLDTAPEQDPLKQDFGTNLVWIIIPVLLLIAGTAVAIVILKKKRQADV